MRSVRRCSCCRLSSSERAHKFDMPQTAAESPQCVPVVAPGSSFSNLFAEGVPAAGDHENDGTLAHTGSSRLQLFLCFSAGSEDGDLLARELPPVLHSLPHLRGETSAYCSSR